MKVKTKDLRYAYSLVKKPKISFFYKKADFSFGTIIA